MYDLKPLEYEAWLPTRINLHLLCQIVGKIKMDLHPKMNHWWHVTLRLNPNGIRTGYIPHPHRPLEIVINIQKMMVEIKIFNEEDQLIAIENETTIASLYSNIVGHVKKMGYDLHMVDKPYENPYSTTPFSKDTEIRAWDKSYMTRYLNALHFIDDCFTSFSGESFYKTSPCQLFWHSFDFVVTRFSGKEVDLFIDTDNRTDIEAYSHEVKSFGFWPGDPKTPYPMFYSYTAPEPSGIEKYDLQPEGASWVDVGGSH